MPLSPFATLDEHRRRPGAVANDADFNLNDGRNNLLIHALIREESERAAAKDPNNAKKRQSMPLENDPAFELKYGEAIAIDPDYLSNVILKDYLDEHGFSREEVVGASRVLSDEQKREQISRMKLSGDIDDEAAEAALASIMRGGSGELADNSMADTSIDAGN